MKKIQLALNDFRRFVLRKYRNESFDLWIKSDLLLTLLLLLALLFPLLTLFNVISGRSLQHYDVYLTLVDSAILAVIVLILTMGHYKAAVVATIAVLAFSNITAIAFTDFFEPNLGFMHKFYFAFPLMVFHALVGNKRDFFYIPIVYALLAAACYYITSHYVEAGEIPILRQFLVDFIFSMLFVYVLGYFIIKTNDSIIVKLQENNELLKAEMTERASLEREMVLINESLRKRIGFELHDDLGQLLIAIDMRNKLLIESVKNKSSEKYARLETISSLINQAISKVRNMARGMGPANLNPENLPSALNEMASFIEDTHGISCRFTYDPRALVADDITAVNLYHIAQEAVNNAVKHGKPKCIDITLASNDGSVEITVSDDGTGFVKNEGKAMGSGMRIMKYRADVINASIQIQSGPAGTSVTCTLRA
ncbi:MAG: sensor histidine kinase [Spirochaetes bacterium]|nr:sensor histidine kinase [Spirochaetota bacterium]